MAMQQLNLIDAHFQNSSLFAALPVFDEIYYLGHPEGKIQKYKAVREGQACTLVALTIIRQEENFLWESTEDFLERSIYMASQAVHGVYVFDLLAFDVHKELKTFDYNELMTIIVNNSRKTPPGQQRLIKYSSAYGILQKLVHEDWGKITFKTSVEVFKHKPTQLDVAVRNLFRFGEFAHGPFIGLINDLSSEPLFNTADELQQKLLMDVVNKQAENSIEFLPEVYIQDKNGVRELLSGTKVK